MLMMPVAIFSYKIAKAFGADNAGTNFDARAVDM